MTTKHKQPTSKCTVYDGYHIPGCMGCAVWGHKAGCTCGPGARAGGIDANPEETAEQMAERLLHQERMQNEALQGPQPMRLPPFTVVPEPK